jgi:hypothetical protein
VGRSTAFWATNRYLEHRAEPKPSAPYRDLPPGLAQRFRRVREGLLALEGVTEQVKYMGPSWRWVWEFSVAPRKLCWLHVMEGGISATFTVSEPEARRALALAKVSAAIVSAIRCGQQTGPVRWCFLDLTDQKLADALLGFLRRKVTWLAEEAPQPTTRRSLAG